MKTKKLDLYFNIYEALLNQLKTQIAEATELDQETLDAELEKISIEFEDGGHACADQDSGNLYHANYFAEGYIEYEGNNPKIMEAILFFDENQESNEIVKEIVEKLKTLTKAQLSELAEICWLETTEFNKEQSQEEDIFQIATYIDGEVIWNQFDCTEMATQNIYSGLNKANSQESLFKYFKYLVTNEFTKESDLLENFN